jgi:hypothetical protein
MYRLWVEHPKFVPDDVAAKMDWRAGEDKGRIWRIVPEKAPDVKPFVPPTTTEDLVTMLSDGNAGEECWLSDCWWKASERMRKSCCELK